MQGFCVLRMTNTQKRHKNILDSACLRTISAKIKCFVYTAPDLQYIERLSMTINYIFMYAGFVTDCQKIRYGLKGSSIHLSISLRNQSHQHNNVNWRRFNRRELLGDRDGVPGKLKIRMSLNYSDWSLTILNLQEDDSGLYEALSKHEEQTLAAFTLKVESKICASHLHCMLIT